MKLWVDDIRWPAGTNDIPSLANSGWTWVFTSEQAITLLRVCKQRDIEIEKMSLDHDLGGDDTTRPIVLWCCEHNYWPREVVVHSANPIGVDWLEGMIERYHPTGIHNPERYK